MVIPELTKEECETLERAAKILERIEVTYPGQFGFDSYNDSHDLDDIVKPIREITGRASGKYQYEHPIGPDRKPMTPQQAAELAREMKRSIGEFPATIKQAINRVDLNYSRLFSR